MTFSDEDLYEAVQHYLPKVNEYIASHGGSIELLGVKDGKVYIRLAGACSGCSMSLMTTKMVVQKKLRELIHPELSVINVDGTPENEPPVDLFVPQLKEQKDNTNQEETTSSSSLMKNIKKIVGLG